ncbi:LysR substrate-binding domain-containing protein [Flammeovirga sp. SJP92]|uniref:LysR substrate-binding domain-containing protein n=1 Tax=Flammeovirga sp. SJP92 TaxID=1775430 RepID=UPI0007880B2C|nr:LysR substrate-binding domain-containing protein [Flammeovirga sp. SJP92]KXX71257.1 LysR family transcriptional regulator [Flammeovirga sp. SJP92]
MNFTLHQLKVLLKIAEHQSITKASEELYLTQPAVSLQLKKLQDQFELPLTEVIGRQLYITNFGKEIVERSKKILEEAEGIKYTVDQYKGLVSGSIKISVVSTGKYVIPYYLKDFMDKYPSVEIKIDVSNKVKVIEGLANNESDFSLVSVLPPDLKVNTVELIENRLFLIGSSFSNVKIRRPKDLEKVTLLFREEGSATRNAMQDYLKENNVNVKKSMELVSNEAVKQAINAGIGFSIVPLIGSKLFLESESVKFYHLKGLPIESKWHIIYNRGKKLTPAHQALLDYIEEHKEEIGQKYFSWALKEI